MTLPSHGERWLAGQLTQRQFHILVWVQPGLHRRCKVSFLAECELMHRAVGNHYHMPAAPEQVIAVGALSKEILDVLRLGVFQIDLDCGGGGGGSRGGTGGGGGLRGVVGLFGWGGGGGGVCCGLPFAGGGGAAGCRAAPRDPG